MFTDEMRNDRVAVPDRFAVIDQVGKLTARGGGRIEDVLVLEPQADELEKGEHLEAKAVVVGHSEQAGPGIESDHLSSSAVCGATMKSRMSCATQASHLFFCNFSQSIHFLVPCIRWTGPSPTRKRFCAEIPEISGRSTWLAPCCYRPSNSRKPSNICGRHCNSTIARMRR